MKIGDKIYCHTECRIKGTEIISISKNKLYEIIKINEESFVVIDNHKTQHIFTLNNYKTWFMTLENFKKLRKSKIIKINEQY